MIFVLSGGGASLNFKVVGGTTQPSSASENTIWVNTSTAITSHVFSATQPTNLVAGMVWFPLSNTSTNAFNALKKNDVQVYISIAFQYVGSAWVQKELFIYQEGEWKTFKVFLFNNGDLGISGGFTCINSNGTDASDRLAIGDTITLQRVQYSNYGIYSNNKIDVTGFKTLKVDCYSQAYIGDGSRLGVGLSKDLVYENFAVKSAVTMSRKVHEIDISSLSGEYYFVMWHYVYGSMSSGYAYIYSIELV